MPHSASTAQGRVVMLNGWSCPAPLWGGLDAALGAAGLEVLRMEMPGWDPDAACPAGGHPADLAEALVPRLLPLGRLRGLVGYSLGAQVAVHVARGAPGLAERVVAITPPVMPAGRHRLPREGRDLIDVPVVGPALLVAGVARLRRSPRALRRLWRRMSGDPGALDALPALTGLAAGVTERLAATPLRHSARTFLGALRCDLRAVAPGVRAPTLWVAGELDPLCMPDDCAGLAAGMQDARVLPVGGAGHFVHLERPEEVRPAVTGFLT